ncbi:flagellar basal body rod protein FlgB [Chromobacterium amazonense]|uniref:flagellar basal body rod protein FlgB n=1 Tax=Chromobacterium amazonense TaxID=1382803 RepID=UPI0031F6A89D
MAFDFGSVLGVHSVALRLHGERTKLIASNLANQNTPGYQAMDLDFKEALAATAAGSNGTTDFFEDFDGGAARGFRRPNLPSKDGNTVELGVEQAAFSQNANDFQTSLSFINLKISGLMHAIRGEV